MKNAYIERARNVPALSTSGAKATVCMLAVAALLVFYPLTSHAQTATIDKPQAAWGEQFIDNRYPSCGDKKEIFTEYPVDLSLINFINPLGNLGPPAHVHPTPHTYWFFDGYGCVNNNSAPAAPVYAVGRIWVTRVWRQTKDWYDQSIEDNNDYDLEFRACAEVAGYYNHLSKINERILSQVEFGNCEVNQQDSYTATYCYAETNIEFQAGEKIGEAGGLPVGNSFDIGLRDFRNAPFPFLNDRNMRNSFYTVCPLDYFTADKAQVLKAMLGDGADCTGVSAPGNCGSIFYDVPGTLSGRWFLQGMGSKGPEWNSGLSLARDDVEPEKYVVSIGEVLPGMAAGKFWFLPREEGLINRRFSEISADGNRYCFECTRWYTGEQTSFVVQLSADGVLKVEGRESQCGAEPWDFSEGDYALFER